GSNIRIDLGVDRYGVHDDLNIVIEALGEQGAQRTVDQARCEGFFFRRTALTLEEPTGDTSRCIRFLDVVDGQGEKVLPGFGLLGSNNGSQNDGVSNRSQYGARSLARDFTGFENHRMLTILKRLGHFIKHYGISLQ